MKRCYQANIIGYFCGAAALAFCHFGIGKEFDMERGEEIKENNKYLRQKLGERRRCSSRKSNEIEDLVQIDAH